MKPILVLDTYDVLKLFFNKTIYTLSLAIFLSCKLDEKFNYDPNSLKSFIQEHLMNLLFFCSQFSQGELHN